jgi:hypothetical protein
MFGSIELVGYQLAVPGENRVWLGYAGSIQASQHLANELQISIPSTAATTKQVI